jgi:hypothetical protein
MCLLVLSGRPLGHPFAGLELTSTTCYRLNGFKSKGEKNKKEHHVFKNLEAL